MFSLITKLFKNARKHPQGQEPLQTNLPANTSRKESHLEWKSLDVAQLNLTSSHLRNIEASMAEKSRAEFAAVTKSLNASQRSKRANKELVNDD